MHFKLGENLGGVITSLVREMAWDEGRISDAILFLVDINPVVTPDIAREVINGKRQVVTHDESHLILKEDSWEAPDLAPDLENMKKFIENVCALSEGRNYMGREWSPVGIHYKHNPDKYAREDRISIKEIEKFNVVVAHKKAQRLLTYLNDKTRSYYAEIIVGSADNTNVLTEMPKLLNKLDDASLLSQFDRIEDPVERERLKRIEKGILTVDGVTVKKDPKFKDDTGWLNRAGEYFSCELGQHIALADLIVEEMFPLWRPDEETPNPQKFLEDSGWVKCTGREWHYMSKKYLTQKQLETLSKWCEKWGKSITWNLQTRSITSITEMKGVF